MADWARRFGAVRRRRTAGLIAAALVGTVVIGVIAPASQAGQPTIAFTPSSWSPGPVAVGSSASQVFTLKNSGASATGALTVVLSGSAAFTITQNGCPSPTSLPKGASCSLTITYRPTASGATDHATLTALGREVRRSRDRHAHGDLCAGSRSGDHEERVASPSPVVPGDATAYTITVSNLGPNDVTGASVADTMPAAITSDTFTASQTGGASGFTTGTGTRATSATPVNMPAGSTITYAVNAEISSAATGTLSNTATVSAPAGVIDPNLANNSATVAPRVVPMADLSVTNTQAPTSVDPGGQTVYTTITVTNNGPSDAPGRCR